MVKVRYKDRNDGEREKLGQAIQMQYIPLAKIIIGKEYHEQVKGTYNKEKLQSSV